MPNSVRAILVEAAFHRFWNTPGLVLAFKPIVEQIAAFSRDTPEPTPENLDQLMSPNGDLVPEGWHFTNFNVQRPLVKRLLPPPIAASRVSFRSATKLTIRNSLEFYFHSKIAARNLSNFQSAAGVSPLSGDRDVLGKRHVEQPLLTDLELLTGGRVNDVDAELSAWT